VNIIIGFQENNIGYVLEVKNEIWNSECGYKWAIEHYTILKLGPNNK